MLPAPAPANDRGPPPLDSPPPPAPFDPIARLSGLTAGCERGGTQIGVDDSKEKLQKIIDSIRQLL